MDLSLKRLSTLNKNIALSAVIKVFNILFVVLIVRRSIDVLGVAEYGIWTAITSISTWVSLLDIGIGNGLRVELRRCFIEKDWTEARILLNTAYKFIGFICLSVLAVFFLIWLNTDWSAVFNIKNYSVQNVGILVLVTIMGLVIQLVFSLLQPVLNANLHSGFEGICFAIANGLILVYLMCVDAQSINILQYGFVSAFTAPLVYLGFSFFYYKTYVPQIIPDFKETNFEKIKAILLLGGKFFVIQVSAILMYQMTSFLIIRYFSPNEVTEYNVAFRYFNLFYIVFVTLLSPLWSMSTDAYLRGDTGWIIGTIKKYLLVFLAILIALTLGYLVRDFIFKIWLKDVFVSPKIALYVAIYMAILSWNTIFLYVVNGTGKIHFQFILAIVAVILYFPLTHFLVKILAWGIDGIFIANMIVLLIFSVFIPLQTYFLLKTEKQGIWRK
jgi:O-antigen/teichoic acid export membrane protein